MSFEEKNAWAFGLQAVLVSGAYFVYLLVQVQRMPATEIPYVRPLVYTLIAAIAFSILSSIVVAVSNPREVGKGDERDRRIKRTGEAVGFYFFSITAVVPLVLAMRDADSFWIANSLFLASSLTSVVFSAVKITAYRKGV